MAPKSRWQDGRVAAQPPSQHAMPPGLPHAPLCRVHDSAPFALDEKRKRGARGAVSPPRRRNRREFPPLEMPSSFSALLVCSRTTNISWPSMWRLHCAGSPVTRTPGKHVTNENNSGLPPVPSCLCAWVGPKVDSLTTYTQAHRAATTSSAGVGVARALPSNHKVLATGEGTAALGKQRMHASCCLQDLCRKRLKTLENWRGWSA